MVPVSLSVLGVCHRLIRMADAAGWVIGCVIAWTAEAVEEGTVGEGMVEG